MYFDAVVVEVKTFITFNQIGSGHTVYIVRILKYVDFGSLRCEKNILMKLQILKKDCLGWTVNETL